MEHDQFMNEVGANPGPELPGDGGMELAANAELAPRPMGDAQRVELTDGRQVLVSGDPAWASQFNHFQGDNPEGYASTCGLVSCEDILRQFGQNVSEAAILDYAMEHDLCNVTDAPEFSGTTTPYNQEQILEDFGIDSHVECGDSLDDLVERVDQGRGVIAEINSATLWGTADFNNGLPDHAIVVTGVARNPETGAVEGFFINDSGVPPQGAAGEFVDVATMERAWLGGMGAGSMIVTEQPVSELADGPGTAQANATPAASPAD